MDRFVSYAQNFEDVMLWRALRHVRQGFYIDAGASEPETDSVTFAFYQRGWSGLNIEPAPAPFSRLVQARPRDINLNVALGAVDGEAEFLLVDGGNGLSTLRRERREVLEAEGRSVELRQVPMRRLANLCSDHAPKDIHFLSIDVEGAEREVIEGADLAVWRPWIVVVEATEPNTTVATYKSWEPFITSAGYNVVYTDGLNRFYLAQEHDDLAGAFSTPPNVFDHFIRRDEWQAKRDATELYRRVVEQDALLQVKSNHETRLLERLENTTKERDAVNQELWESNRLVGVLQAERQGLVDQAGQVWTESQSLITQSGQLSLMREWLSGQENDLKIARDALLEQEAKILAAQQALVEQETQARAAQQALAEHDMQLQAERQSLAARESQLAAGQAAVAEQQHRLNEAERKLERELAAVYRSTSWRVTAPLRRLKRITMRP